MLKNSTPPSRHRTPTHSRQSSLSSKSSYLNNSYSKASIRRTSYASTECPLDYTMTTESKPSVLETSTLYTSVVEKDQPQQNNQIRRKDIPLPTNSNVKKVASRRGSNESLGQKESGKKAQVPSTSSTYSSNFEKDNVDTEISDRMAKLQHELNALNIAQPGKPVSGQMPPVKYTSFLEIVGQLREIIHKLQLKDAVQRQEITKLKKSNISYKNMVTDLEQKVQELEKLREQDIQYLLKLDNFLLYEKKRNKTAQKSAPKEKAANVPQNQMSEIKDAMNNLEDKISGLTNEKKKLNQMFKRIGGDERQVKVERIEDYPNPIHYYSASENDKPFINPQYTNQPVVHEWNESGFDQATYDLATLSSAHEKSDRMLENLKNIDFSQVEPVTMGDIDNEEDGVHQDTTFSHEHSPPNAHSFTLQGPKKEQLNYISGPFEADNNQYSSNIKKTNYRSEDLPVPYKQPISSENQYSSKKETSLPMQRSVFVDMNQSNRGNQSNSMEKSDSSPLRTPKTVYTKLTELDLNRQSSAKTAKRPFESETLPDQLDTFPSTQVNPFDGIPPIRRYETSTENYSGYSIEPQVRVNNTQSNRDTKPLRLENVNPAVADIINEYKQSLLDSFGSGKPKEIQNNVDTSQYSSNGVSNKPENRRYFVSSQESAHIKNDTKESFVKEESIKRNHFYESECDPIDAVEDEKMEDRGINFDEYCSKLCMDINAVLMEPSMVSMVTDESSRFNNQAVNPMVMRQKMATQEPYGSQVQNQLSTPPHTAKTAGGSQRSTSSRNGVL